MLKELIPFEHIREQQEIALDFIEKSQKRFVILEMPTGSGKSGVAIAAGRGVKENAYIITSQKILQDQYSKDFEKEDWYATIKGVKNYTCSLNGLNAKNGLCAAQSVIKKHCWNKGLCPYLEALKTFKRTKIGNTNYAYFFYINGQGCLPVLFKRQLMICDEAHNIEKEIVNYISFTVNKSSFERTRVKLDKLPEFETQKEYQDWAMKIMVPILEEKDELESKISDIMKRYLRGFDPKKLTDKDIEAITKLEIPAEDKKLLTLLRGKFEYLDKLSVKFRKFGSTYREETWLWNFSRNEKTKELEEIEFKPATVKTIASDVLFDYGEKIVLMSATIIDKKQFCKSLGINLEEVDFLSVDSDFPIENRLIYGCKTGKMGYEHIEKTKPNIINSIVGILEEHYNEKGIIHTQNFELARYIEANIPEDYKGRLIFHEGGEAKDAYEEHVNSRKKSVLCTPSMFEGVDLEGDLSRFQIIIKLPWPFLGDNFVKTRNKVDEGFMEYEMIKRLMQTAGRSIRSKDDYCTTYVLDSAFEWWMEKNKNKMPKYFLESIKNISEKNEN